MAKKETKAVVANATENKTTATKTAKTTTSKVDNKVVEPEVSSPTAPTVKTKSAKKPAAPKAEKKTTKAAAAPKAEKKTTKAAVKKPAVKKPAVKKTTAKSAAAPKAVKKTTTKAAAVKPARKGREEPIFNEEINYIVARIRKASEKGQKNVGHYSYLLKSTLDYLTDMGVTWKPTGKHGYNFNVPRKNSKAANKVAEFKNL